MACDPTDIPDTDVKPSWMSGFSKWSCFCKLNPLHILGNLYGALIQIRDAIQAYTDASQEKGYAVSSQHFRVAGGDAVINGQVIDEILVRSAFNNKVVGFGASLLSSGDMVGGNIVSVRLYDFTAGTFASDAINLTTSQLHGNHTDDGNAITNNNITPGHNYGVKITITGGFTLSDLDVFIFMEPNELTY